MDQSAVSVDVVALRFWAEDTAIAFGVGAREHPPGPVQPALPGVLLRRGERLTDAAGRAVHTELGVPVAAVGPAGHLVTFDEPRPDPRGPVLSIVMWVVIGPHHGPARWESFDEAPALAVDHDRLVTTARGLLSGLLWKDLTLTRALLGAQFPATRAVALTASLLGAHPDAANLNRTLAAVPGLTKTEERRRTKATGRPAAVWAFRADH